MSNHFGFIAADTSRTRCYLSALIENNLLPSWILVLIDKSSPTKKPGQFANSSSNCVSDPDWPESDFDLNVPLLPWLNHLGIETIISESSDINDPRVISLISNSDPDVLIYSGYGGVLLGRNALETGKKFLHVHGGYLPDYKGSTTNYYSLLSEQYLGASSLFLSSQIDSGPIIQRFKFSAPTDPTLIDHVYDSAVRARVLVSTIREWQATGTWNYALQENVGGDVYYIIHPILKHLAIINASRT